MTPRPVTRDSARARASRRFRTRHVRGQQPLFVRAGLSAGVNDAPDLLERVCTEREARVVAGAVERMHAERSRSKDEYTGRSRSVGEAALELLTTPLHMWTRVERAVARVAL